MRGARRAGPCAASMPTTSSGVAVTCAAPKTPTPERSAKRERGRDELRERRALDEHSGGAVRRVVGERARMVLAAIGIGHAVGEDARIAVQLAQLPEQRAGAPEPHHREEDRRVGVLQLVQQAIERPGRPGVRGEGEVRALQPVALDRELLAREPGRTEWRRLHVVSPSDIATVLMAAGIRARPIGGESRARCWESRRLDVARRGVVVKRALKVAPPGRAVSVELQGLTLTPMSGCKVRAVPIRGTSPG